MTARLYDANQLAQTLFRDFPRYENAPLFLNATYCAVTKEWVDDLFGPYLYKVQKARGNVTYKRRGNQCEHFAIRAAMEAVDLFRAMADDSIPVAAESLAVATIIYQSRAGTPHAMKHMVNVWYIGGFWREWEPQTRSWFQMTDAERKTAMNPIVF